jgi:hypothetical protein
MLEELPPVLQMVLADLHRNEILKNIQGKKFGTFTLYVNICKSNAIPTILVTTLTSSYYVLPQALEDCVCTRLSGHL